MSLGILNYFIIAAAVPRRRAAELPLAAAAVAVAVAAARWQPPTPVAEGAGRDANAGAVVAAAARVPGVAAAVEVFADAEAAGLWQQAVVAAADPPVLPTPLLPPRPWPGES